MPHLERRDEELYAELIPLYDPTGRLFLASEAPVPVDEQLSIQKQELDLKYGIVSVNEVRSQRRLPPVPWGNVPWLPQRWVPTDVPRTQPGEQWRPAPSDNYGGEEDDPVVDDQ